MYNLKENKLKSELQSNIVTIGSWLSIPSPQVAEIMSQAGFPWLVIDLEHGITNLETMQAMIVAIELNQCLPLVRVSGKNSNDIKKILDAGAYGIITPMVNTPEEAYNTVQSIKYPPEGNRGVGLGRVQFYGTKFDEYYHQFNKYSLVILQIENKIAVDNIDEILSVSGIDAIIIGPYDLSGSYGIPGDLENPIILEAENKILSASTKRGIPAGVHVVHAKKELLQSKLNRGFKFIAYGVDMLFLAKSSGQAVIDINKNK